jgi:hypothetical protein
MGKGMCEKGLWPQKLKTIVKVRFVNKIIMFEEVLEFKKAILKMLWLVKDNCFATNGS